jgi:protein involved in polysaccharide export with SLBB domain
MGLDLPIFGAQLFEGVPTTFSPLDNVPVTPDYMIGPGDEILIRGWGAVDIDYRAVVDRTGAISIPRVGVVQVAGVRYQSLSEHLRRAVGRVFRNFELTATLGQLRSIQVYVVGQARQPGAYTVSSLSTLVNTVFAAGGPGPTGSMRRVELKRGGKVVSRFDLYDLLVSGDKSHDVSLLPGDVIFFPAVGPLVAVAGSVNTPAVFELKRGETLAEVLNYAGGLSSLAEGRRVTVERVHARQVRKVDEFTLDVAGLARSLSDGDVVTVYSIVPRMDNSVSLRGNVAQPAHMPWRSGMRVRDLIPERAALLSRSYWLGRTRLAPAPRSEGADKKAEALERRTVDELRPPEGEVNWDYAVIERINPTDYSTSLVPFRLGKAVIDGDPEQNLLLEPGDVVTIFSKSDVRVPTAHQTRYVRLEGEMAQAGVFQVQPGETLRQLVRRVGGLSPNAYLFAAELNRESTRMMQQEKLDAAADRLEREAQRVVASQVQNALSPADAQSAQAQAAAQMALIAKLRGIKATGRIVLEVPPGGRDVKDLPDIPLEDGDRFYAPPMPSTVSVFGAVYNENAFLHKGGKKMEDYLRQAGGPTKDADEDAMYVIRADGSVVSKSQGSVFSANGRLASLKMMPGDALVVPEKLDRTEFRRALRDWTQIFSQFGLGVAALRVLKGL